jgi:hypothetical protein
MTVVTNLLGGPGSSKSTTAARLFADLKSAGYNAELVTEYVKQWAWEGRRPEPLDQFYLFAKQARREYSVIGKVEHLVTDSPVLLSGFYAQKYGGADLAAMFRPMVLAYLRAVEKRAQYEYVFLRRAKPYNPAGRYQTEDEAKQIDAELRRYCDEMGIEYHDIDGDARASAKIFTNVIGASHE